MLNGTTIVQDHRCERVDYFHIELDQHSVILAEGAASETFVDDDSRAVFYNAGEWAALHSDHTSAAVVFCAPRIEGGFALERIRRRLAGVAHRDAVAA